MLLSVAWVHALQQPLLAATVGQKVRKQVEQSLHLGKSMIHLWTVTKLDLKHSPEDGVAGREGGRAGYKNDCESNTVSKLHCPWPGCKREFVSTNHKHIARLGVFK